MTGNTVQAVGVLVMDLTNDATLTPGTKLGRRDIGRQCHRGRFAVQADIASLGKAKWFGDNSVERLV